MPCCSRRGNCRGTARRAPTACHPVFGTRGTPTSNATDCPKCTGGLPTFRRGARPCAPTCHGALAGGVASWAVAPGAPGTSGALIQMIPCTWLGIATNASIAISSGIAGDPRRGTARRAPTASHPVFEVRRATTLPTVLLLVHADLNPARNEPDVQRNGLSIMYWRAALSSDSLRKTRS